MNSHTSFVPLLCYHLYKHTHLEGASVIIYIMALMATSQNSFYVTCTSNKCREFYPDNKTSSFTTRLQQPIVLKNADRKWEVGVSSFTYSQGINNFGECMLMEMYIYDGLKVHTIKLADDHVNSADQIGKCLQQAYDAYTQDFEALLSDFNSESEVVIVRMGEEDGDDYDDGDDDDEEYMQDSSSSASHIPSKRRKRSTNEEKENNLESQLGSHVESVIDHCLKGILISYLSLEGLNDQYSLNNKFFLVHHMFLSSRTKRYVFDLWKSVQATIQEHQREKEMFSTTVLLSEYNLLEAIAMKYGLPLSRVSKLLSHVYEYDTFFKNLITTNKGKFDLDTVVSLTTPLRNKLASTEAFSEKDFRFFSECREVSQTYIQTLRRDHDNVLNHTTLHIRKIMDLNDVTSINNLLETFQSIKDWSAESVKMISTKMLEEGSEELNLFFFEALHHFINAEMWVNIVRSVYDMKKKDSVHSSFVTMYDEILGNSQGISKRSSIPETQENVLTLIEKHFSEGYDQFSHQIMFNNDNANNDEKQRTDFKNQLKNQRIAFNLTKTELDAMRRTHIFAIRKYHAKGEKNKVKMLLDSTHQDPLFRYIPSSFLEQVVVSDYTLEEVLDKIDQKEKTVLNTNRNNSVHKTEEIMTPTFNMDKKLKDKDTTLSGEEKEKPSSEPKIKVLGTPNTSDEDQGEKSVGTSHTDIVKPVEQSTQGTLIYHTDEHVKQLSLDPKRHHGLYISTKMFNLPKMNKMRERRRKMKRITLYPNMIRIRSEMDRIQFNFTVPFMDIAFSPTLLQALGMMSQSQFSRESLYKRIQLKRILGYENEILVNVTKFYNNVVKSIKHSRSVVEFYSDVDRFDVYKKAHIDPLSIEQNIHRIANESNVTVNELITSLFNQKEIKHLRDNVFSTNQFPLVDAITYTLYKNLPFERIVGKEAVNYQVANLVFLYSNIIQPECMDNERARLLEIMSIRSLAGGKIDQIEFSNTHYKALDVDQVSDIKFFIASSLGTPVPFRYGPATVQLHFRRKP